MTLTVESVEKRFPPPAAPAGCCCCSCGRLPDSTLPSLLPLPGTPNLWRRGPEPSWPAPAASLQSLSVPQAAVLGAVLEAGAGGRKQPKGLCRGRSPQSEGVCAPSMLLWLRHKPCTSYTCGPEAEAWMSREEVDVSELGGCGLYLCPLLLRTSPLVAAPIGQ